jgi:hypothetical protein
MRLSPPPLCGTSSPSAGPGPVGAERAFSQSAPAIRTWIPDLFRRSAVFRIEKNRPMRVFACKRLQGGDTKPQAGVTRSSFLRRNDYENRML